MTMVFHRNSSSGAAFQAFVGWQARAMAVYDMLCWKHFLRRVNWCLALFILCTALFAAGGVAAAPLKVVGRFLQDSHGSNIQMRGVNLPVYKSGYADDLDAVAAAIALTRTNAVRLEWWALPPAGTTEYSLANFDRAIQKFYDLGIIPVV